MKAFKSLLILMSEFFPFRLLINHIKRNQAFLLIWIFLFAVTVGNFGSYLGIPYLFLDPEYLNNVGFVSFFFMGIAIAGFTIAFHIATYINDGLRFRFVGTIKKPFTHFSINNSLIPFTFFIVYLWSVVRFQLDNEFATGADIVLFTLGFICGYGLMMTLLYTYFRKTNTDIFKQLVNKVDEKLKHTIPATRANAMNKVKMFRKKPEKIGHYISVHLRIRKVIDHDGYYDRSMVTQVFDQNHLNLVVLQVLVIVSFVVLGFFKDYVIFQIPAAATLVLFLSLVLMVFGAFTYWFRNWTFSVLIGMAILLNIFIKQGWLHNNYAAFGLNYNTDPTEYSQKTVREHNATKTIETDRKNTFKSLQAWRKKFGDTSPKMVFICASGGGQRAALWTLRALQQADSATDGKLTNHAILMTGASGGLIGAAYYRELLLLKSQDSLINLSDSKYLTNMGKDHLNPIIFSFLANDIFVPFQKFKYAGHSYLKDRGYSFEQQLNLNTEGILDKPLSAYYIPEVEAQIPMMIVAPTIINDGRKLFISPQHVSFMNSGEDHDHAAFDKVDEGLDFRRFFANHGPDSLRFLSALRMGATFPYVTPNVTLPTEPSMEIMDAGLIDNFGISDAVRFLYAYKEWIAENTDGVIMVSIRDSKKEGPIAQRTNLSLTDKLFTPIESVYRNIANLQNINNDSKVEYAQSWFDNSLDLVTIQYVPKANPKRRERAALSWHLTAREKKNIIDNIYSNGNQEAIELLKKALN